MESERKNLLKKWRKKIRDAQRAHYIMASRYFKMNYYIGIPVVCFTVFVGSSLFSELQGHDVLIIKIIVGIISLVAAILASLQTFLRFPEKAEVHRSVAIRFGILKKEIDKYLATAPGDLKVVDMKIDNFKQIWDEIVSESPTVSNNLWADIKGRLDIGGNGN